MKNFIVNLCVIVVCVLLSGCAGWDTWKLDRQWSEEISILSRAESKKQVDRIAIVRSNRKRDQMYLTFAEFMKQKPLFIEDRDKIVLLLDEISWNSKLDNFHCSLKEEKDYSYHIVAFDSATMRAAYLILHPCNDGIHSRVWNLYESGIYWIKNPSIVDEKGIVRHLE